jgi:CMP-N-acetylneuraminic acid synthetase
MTSRIAIIPARGGSTRLPRKNVLPFCGKPLVAWTIEAALNSGIFNKVLVSTDDEEIARISRHYGASVPFLRDRHADQHSPSSLATLVALHQAEEHWAERYQTVAQLLPTCPLRDAKNIRELVAIFERNGHPSLISVFSFGWLNPWWATRMHSDGQPEWLFPDAINKRSQDLDILYCPSGAVWLAQAHILREAKTFYAPGHAIAPIPWQSAIDIDDEADFAMAEAMLRFGVAG